MKLRLINGIIHIVTILILLASCSTGKIVLSNNADISKYKYVIFGNESSGDRELDDIVMAVQNQITETSLKVLSTSDVSSIRMTDSILTPNIHITSEKWDGGYTYITVTFYEYSNNQCIAVVKSSGIGVTVSHDQNIALGAIKKKLDKLFPKP